MRLERRAARVFNVLASRSGPGEGRVGTAGALVGGVPEVLGRLLERVAARQREDLLVGGDEVGHPGRRADDERLARRVQVRLGPRQHPHASQLKNGGYELSGRSSCSAYL